MNWFLNLLDRNEIEWNLKREKVQMKPPNHSVHIQTYGYEDAKFVLNTVSETLQKKDSDRCMFIV